MLDFSSASNQSETNSTRQQQISKHLNLGQNLDADTNGNLLYTLPPAASGARKRSPSSTKQSGGQRKRGNALVDSGFSEDTDTLINTASIIPVEEENDSMATEDLDLEQSHVDQQRLRPSCSLESMKKDFEMALNDASDVGRTKSDQDRNMLLDDECTETIFEDARSRIQPVEKMTEITAHTPQNHQQLPFLPSDAVLTVCCAMYRLWIRKPHSDSTSAPPLDFPFVATPAAYTEHSLDAGYKRNYPIGTKSWFPLFVFIMNNVIKKSRVSLPVVMVALLYVGRFRNLVSLSPHTTPSLPPPPEIQLSQIFITAIIIAQKVHSDVRYSNAEWARISHFTTGSLNEMERHWMFYYLRLNAKFSVTPLQYKQWQAICQSLQVEYEFVFKSKMVPDHFLAAYLGRARRYRPELVEEILRDRGFFGGLEELEATTFSAASASAAEGETYQGKGLVGCM